MPKRLIDGEGIWRSNKLATVKPTWMRAEYANLVPLALADGTFECQAELVWAHVYSFNRPDIKVADVVAILEEFASRGLLFRWLDIDSGKTWGFWVGIDKGRLPPASRMFNKEFAIGKTPPPDLLSEYVRDTYAGLGLVGKGLGKEGEVRTASAKVITPEEIEFKGKYLRISATEHGALVAGFVDFTPDELRACYRDQDFWQVANPARRKTKHLAAMRNWLLIERKKRIEGQRTLSVVQREANVGAPPAVNIRVKPEILARERERQKGAS